YLRIAQHKKRFETLIVKGITACMPLSEANVFYEASSKLKIGLALSGCILSMAASAQYVGSWTPLASGRHRSRLGREARTAYITAIQRTADMARDSEAIALARARGLDVLNLTWEDTGRYKGSAVGPNISDMTIQVGYGQRELESDVRCMPVIRYPNFSDKTCDIDPSDFTL